jgi:mannose-6-phosphate isomerase
MPEAILGKGVAKNYHNQLPILVKFIDANDDLSIQVHPDNEMAQREHQKMGKNEMWYILSAEPGACIYAGFQEQLSETDYKNRVADGSIINALAKHHVKAGDVFYIPAGRIHAIGKGIRLLEVQQSSDVTYRIYDYDRLDLNGQPRELHTQLAVQALDYHVYKEYKSEYKENTNTANLCLDTEFFTVRVVDLQETIRRNMVKYDSFVIQSCVEGECKIRIRSTHDEVTLRKGYSCLIPAAIADYDMIPLAPQVKVIESYINNNSQSNFRRFISQFLHMTNE